MVLSDTNSCCWNIWHPDAVVAGCRPAPVLALVGLDPDLANVRGSLLGHMSRDRLGLLADGYWENQGSAAAGRDLSKPCTVSCRNSLGRNIESKPQRPSNGRMGIHLRFRGDRIGIPLLFFSEKVVM